jgi:hypothetical protein
MVAEEENAARGFAETQNGFAPERDAGESGARVQMRYSLRESPLIALARRKDRDGARFLSADLVAAGERLREDFELAQIELNPARQSWDQMVTAPVAKNAAVDAESDASSIARARLVGALAELGPGLGDVVLRCCCYLDGLEATEKKMGWSARSGKIVLRIALQRLKRHYAQLGDSAALIG